MSVKLRLMRMGKKKQPTYRIVAADSRSPRDGRFIEVVGTYAPRSEPSAVSVDNDKAVAWLAKGAQPTDTVRKLLEISGAWADYVTTHPGSRAATRPGHSAAAKARAGAAAPAASSAPASVPSKPVAKAGAAEPAPTTGAGEPTPKAGAAESAPEAGAAESASEAGAAESAPEAVAVEAGTSAGSSSEA